VYPKVCPQNRKKERKQVLARVARNFSIPPQQNSYPRVFHVVSSPKRYQRFGAFLFLPLFTAVYHHPTLGAGNGGGKASARLSITPAMLISIQK
jgi:hypothetical protein